MEGLLQNREMVLISELAEEHSLHESSILKEADADDESDEGLDLLDSSKQR